MTVESTRPAPGRPRDRNADAAILKAAFELIMEVGYARTSIESVAARAGVGKTTIYRRFANKQELAAAAIKHIELVNVPDLGDTRAELAALFEILFEAMFVLHAPRMIGTLLAEELTDPMLLDVFREQVILPRRALVKEILGRGLRRGDLRADLDLETAFDFIFSVSISRYVSGLPVDDQWRGNVIEYAWRMIRA